MLNQYKVSLVDNCSSNVTRLFDLIPDKSVSTKKSLYEAALKGLGLDEPVEDFYSSDYGTRYVLRNKYLMFSIVIEQNP